MLSCAPRASARSLPQSHLEDPATHDDDDCDVEDEEDDEDAGDGAGHDGGVTNGDEFDDASST